MYDNSIGIERIKKEFNHIKNEAVLSLIEGDISTINNDYKHLRVCFKGPKEHHMIMVYIILILY